MGFYFKTFFKIWTPILVRIFGQKCMFWLQTCIVFFLPGAIVSGRTQALKQGILTGSVQLTSLNQFRSAHFKIKNIIFLFTKQATLMRKSTVLSFPLSQYSLVQGSSPAAADGTEREKEYTCLQPKHTFAYCLNLAKCSTIVLPLVKSDLMGKYQKTQQ